MLTLPKYFVPLQSKKHIQDTNTKNTIRKNEKELA